MPSETKQMLAAWTRQFGFAMVIYIVAVVLAAWAPTSPLTVGARKLLMLAPILPGLALIWLTVRSYRRSDEFVRLYVLRAASLAAIIVAVLTLVYSFLEPLGLPRLSAAWISNTLWAIFVVQMTRLIATGK